VAQQALPHTPVLPIPLSLPGHLTPPAGQPPTPSLPQALRLDPQPPPLLQNTRLLLQQRQACLLLPPRLCQNLRARARLFFPCSATLLRMPTMLTLCSLYFGSSWEHAQRSCAGPVQRPYQQRPPCGCLWWHEIPALTLRFRRCQLLLVGRSFLHLILTDITSTRVPTMQGTRA